MTRALTESIDSKSVTIPAAGRQPMPTIRVTIPANAWSKDEKAQIAASLTDALDGVAQASGKGEIKPYINVHIAETAEGGYAMGGNVVG